ncbi:Putative aliphatic sulfonates transport permease protein SsuC (plasmid) [Neorhizobium galegae bv. officinalis bv. officinalis str. HAMBI 1141]|uniref:Putative aliphatic sulfonates transport permease protein SsuC n=1 Tax=Neorhizobium galegae bv. officinalis bv. officinalis str. HAMBI 1141 TaxID=1028801 RepID=A0A068TH91_NEOGA|nr:MULTISPECIES: ABC transporter permease [Neorhizobium]MCJ9669609.1 ABC transporter permease [Neorhizobium sp. SHOUNA12B]MCJ9745986.1 ABC transporter permease [Neorhizobium sp. SHOUNA12A]CDN57474.1 Putative aliphatic sulfonates transport permease protein SsuC [Neorhizobium galegae bv. officinalis bv. officinalis str. HAMBI 1141]
MNRRFSAAVDYTLALGVLLFVWWFATGPMALPAFLLPSPLRTWNALVTIALTGELWRHLGFTLQNIVLGLILGCIAGIAIAYVMTRFPRLAVWLDGPLVILQTAPKIALAPLFVVWFGFGVLSKIILIFSLVFFPVFVGAVAGFRTLDPKMKDLSKLLGLSAVQRFRQIELPAAMPEIFVGLKIGAVQALVGAVLAEWMSGKVGLGYLMTFASATYKTPLLFAAVLMTVVLGLVLHVALTILERRLLSWKGAKNG